MDQVVCSSCGTANDASVKFCGNCGNVLTIATESTLSSQSNTSQPQGSYQPPQGSYQPPQGSYQPPQGGYQQPQGSYQQPQGSYQQPQGGYQQPQGGYQQQRGYQPPLGIVQKSKIAGGLLGIFLGFLGVHNFYLGYTGKAVSQLLISVLSCGILAVVSSIWGLIEGILILTGSINVDAQGIPLRD